MVLVLGGCMVQTSTVAQRGDLWCSVDAVRALCLNGDHCEDARGLARPEV